MKKLTIRWRIMASFAVVLALMVTMATVAYSRLKHIEQQAAFIASDAVPTSIPWLRTSSTGVHDGLNVNINAA